MRLSEVTVTAGWIDIKVVVGPSWMLVMTKVSVEAGKYEVSIWTAVSVPVLVM